MTTMRPASWIYAEEFVPEPEVTAAARARGEQLGCTPVGAGTGAFLRTLAAATGARAVAEVGTGAGVSGLWLLEGMPDDGVLTSIDINRENQQAARAAFAEAAIASGRTRLITGSASQVMPRLADGAYDIVLVDADKSRYREYVEQAIRVLRAGGVLLIDNMLWHDKVADPAARDEVTVTLRDLAKELRDDERVTVAMLPIGDGMLMATKK